MSTELVTAAEIAATAVTVLSPYLTEAGKEAAKTAGKEAVLHGGKLLGWLRGTMTGRGAEALAELEQAPADPDNQGDVRKQLTTLLTENPALADELRALLAETTPAGDALTQTVTGNSNKVVAIGTGGHGNTTTIR